MIEVNDMDFEFVSLKCGIPDTVHSILNGTSIITIDGVYTIADKLSLNKIVFVTLGGDTGKKEITWNPGFFAIAHVIKPPYDYGYSKEKGDKYFKFDINIDVTFPSVFKRSDFIYYQDAFDAAYIGPELSRDPTQAVSLLFGEKAIAVIRCVLDKYPDLKDKFVRIFPSEFMKLVLGPVKRFIAIDAVFGQSVNNILPKLVVQDIDFNSYRNFLTSIKSKPFLLLAGISGTGKSRIVRELARACWEVGTSEYEAHKPKNFEMIQVKPNWHDSSELIGYLSNINGTRFIAGKFLEFVVKAWSEPEKPYFLCLDEMNLAPVEQYFAEYLSVIESRKLENGRIVTDAILSPDKQYSNETVSVNYNKPEESWYLNLINDLLAKTAASEEVQNNLRDQFKKDGIAIPQNLIVVGTVNMDETTFSFSRKVLDRAMTIEMNEVDLLGGLENKHEKIGLIGKNELIGNYVEGSDVYSSYKEVCDKALDYLKAVNDKLEDTPFKVAYRTRNEFLLYVVNNLPYNKDEEGNNLPENFIIARALDEITNMKILSRIEGDETKVKGKFLDDLNSVISAKLAEISGDYIFVTKLDELKETDTTEDGRKMYASVSMAKLDEMKKRLESGYTSFWS